MLTHEDLIRIFTKNEIELFLRCGTAIRPNDALPLVISKLKPEVKRIVEIGPGCGMTTLVMASCENVISIDTFDIKLQIVAVPLWKKFNVDKKINYHIMPSSKDIYEVIDSLDFDFAFVDGSHVYEDELDDVKHVMKCGRVLVDDYDGLQIKRIIDDIGGKQLEDRFGLWMQNEDYSVIEELIAMNLWKEPKNITGNIDKLDFRHLDGVKDNG